MAEKLIMQIHVSLDPSDRTELNGPGGGVLFLPFTGTVDGELFQGVVRPGAVDCQTVNLAGVRHMCARYMLEGTDRAGKPCRILVENNGWFNGDTPDGFPTVPTFLTDSEELAPILHRNVFRGKGTRQPGGVLIQMFQVTED